MNTSKSTKKNQKKSKKNHNKKSRLSLFFIYDIPIYPFTLIISINQTAEQLKKNIEQNKIDVNNNENILIYEQKSVGGTYSLTDNVICIRMLETVDNNLPCIALFQHEIFHAVDYIMLHIGCSLEESSSEAYAYLIQHLTQVSYQIFQNNKFQIL